MLLRFWLLRNSAFTFEDGFSEGGGNGGIFGTILGAIPIVGGILSGLFSLFTGNGIKRAIEKLAGWTSQGFHNVAVFITEHNNWLRNILTWANRALHVLWNSVIKNFFLHILQWIKDAHAWLESHLSPIIDFLKRVRAFVDKYFRLYVKPFLDMLQKIRRFLLVLRLLHIKWAQQLDTRIGQIEYAVAGVFLQARGILNGIIDTVNAVADPMNLLRRPTLILSIRRTFLSLTRVITGMPPGYFFPSPRRGIGAGLGFIPAGSNFSDPGINPPASDFLAGNDGITDFGFAGQGFVADNSDVDATQPVDYFNNDLYDPSPCSDVLSCMRAARQAQLDALQGA